MNRTTAIRVAVVLILGSGCGKSDSNSLVVVTVTAAPGMRAVTQLRVVVSNAGSSDTKLFPQEKSAQAIQFDTTLAVSFSKSRSGELDIAVGALDSESQPVAAGSGSAVIVAGGRADAIVHLALVATGDAAVPDFAVGGDSGTVSDARIADGKIVSDLQQTGADARDLGGVGGIFGGGGMVATGGATGTGGIKATGGVMGSGGVVGSGGRVGSGGLAGSGGLVGTGGRDGTGGVVGSGGVAGTGGVMGSGGAGVFTAACANAAPISVSVSINTTSAFCFVTCDGSTNGWGCDSFTEKDRTITVNGTAVKCTDPSLPSKNAGGYYYFEVGAGGHTWDAIHLNGPKATSCPVPPGGFSPSP